MAAALLVVVLAGSSCSAGKPDSACPGFQQRSGRFPTARATVTWRGDPGLTGRFDVSSVRVKPRLRKRSRATAVLLHAGMRFQASGWMLCAIDDNGRRLWTQQREGGFSFPVLSGNLLVAPNSSRRDTHLYAFDIRTGKERWRWTQPRQRTDTSGGISIPAISGGRVFVGGSNGLFAIRLSDGRQVWTVEGRDLARSAIAVAGRSLLAVTGDHLLSVDAQTGEQRWATSVHTRAGAAVTEGNGVYVSGTGVSAYTVESGERIWHAEDGSYETPLALADGVLFAAGIFAQESGDLSSEVRAFDVSTGRERWRFTLDSGNSIETIRTPLTVARDVLYAGTNKGLVLALDPRSGNELWRYRAQFRQCLAPDAPQQSGPRCRTINPSFSSYLMQAAPSRVYVGTNTEAFWVLG